MNNLSEFAIRIVHTQLALCPAQQAMKHHNVRKKSNVSNQQLAYT